MNNRYELDTSYFESLIKREFSDLSNFTPDEFARVCARMAATADSSVLDEEEFSVSSRCDHYPVPFGSPAIWRCYKCDLKIDEPEFDEKVERLTMVIGGRMCGRSSQAIEAAKARIVLTSPPVVSAHIAAALAMASIQVKDNDDFIQRKMQGKRRIY